MATKNPYDILGLGKNATDNEIKKAYHRLALKWHPDKNKSNGAEIKFKEISEAYDILSDKDKKDKYDRFGIYDDGNSEFSNDRARHQFNNVHDFLSSMFTNQFYDSGQYGDKARRTMRKGPPKHFNIECTLEELYLGCNKELIIHSKQSNGQSIKKNVKLRIQEGWKDGTKLTYERYGDERPGYIAGDVICVIREKKHRIYRRDKNNLHITLEISSNDASYGFTKYITLLDSKPFELEIYHVPRSDYTQLIKNKGMPYKSNGITSYGDLLIHFIMTFPQLNK
jgi:DnaJ-class molecular chaperone